MENMQVFLENKYDQKSLNIGINKMAMQAKGGRKIKILPSEYAEKCGVAYIDTQSKGVIAKLGQYFTPHPIAKLIVQNFNLTNLGQSIKILDPGAGSGILICALCEELVKLPNKPLQVNVTAYEIDKALIPTLKKGLNYLKKWLAESGVDMKIKVVNKDFVLSNASALNHVTQSQLFNQQRFQKFDLVVANPPYFKISKSDPRAQASASVIHGQPNIYALFMAIAAALLEEKGQLGFITPRSYTSGLYFKKFRQKFFDKITPDFIHIFESRNKAFSKDGVLQENVILHATKTGNTDIEKRNITISSCRDLSDIDKSEKIDIPLKEVMLKQNGYILHIPTRSVHRDILNLISSWDESLHSLGFEVSTGPIVAFRAKQFIESDTGGDACAPLLWLHNIKPMQVCWPLETRRKPKYIAVSEESRRILLPNNNYVLIRRFSAKEEKRRLVAAPLMQEHMESDFIGIENHLNYIHKRDGNMSELEAIGLSALLNSSFFDSYFRIFSGNTQVSATELKRFPLPTSEMIGRVGTLIQEDTDIDRRDHEIVNLIKQYG